MKLSSCSGFANNTKLAFYRQMVWDLVLLSIILYNVSRCAQRGGLAVGISLFAFFFAYAATLLLAPELASFISTRSSAPLPIITLLCMLAVYLLAKRPTKALLQHMFLPKSIIAKRYEAAHRSRRAGAWLGIVRGVMVATAFAVIGTSFARLQDVGFLRQLPDVSASRGVQAADELMSRILERYTRNAGPTTRELIALARHPRRETLDAILEGPFVARLKTSDAVRALVRNQEFRGLIRTQQAAPILVHPAFLRVVSHAVRELQREEPIAATQMP
ncbi:MAG: CvpA family protein [Deltaproteobacteria bacterium]|nr:CvpA family protein [Deltaproteobacteria bacterium]